MPGSRRKSRSLTTRLESEACPCQIPGLRQNQSICPEHFGSNDAAAYRRLGFFWTGHSGRSSKWVVQATRYYHIYRYLCRSPCFFDQHRVFTSRAYALWCARHANCSLTSPTTNARAWNSVCRLSDLQERPAGSRAAEVVGEPEHKSAGDLTSQHRVDHGREVFVDLGDVGVLAEVHRANDGEAVGPY